MKITFDHLQENKIQMTKAGNMTTKSTGQDTTISGVLLSKGQENQAYGKQTKSAQEIKDQAGMLDASDYKNYMAVMASSMSGEDFSAFGKSGASLS